MDSRLFTTGSTMVYEGEGLGAGFLYKTIMNTGSVRIKMNFGPQNTDEYFTLYPGQALTVKGKDALYISYSSEVPGEFVLITHRNPMFFGSDMAGSKQSPYCSSPNGILRTVDYSEWYSLSAEIALVAGSKSNEMIVPKNAGKKIEFMILGTNVRNLDLGTPATNEILMTFQDEDDNPTDPELSLTALYNVDGTPLLTITDVSRSYSHFENWAMVINENKDLEVDVSNGQSNEVVYVRGIYRYI